MLQCWTPGRGISFFFFLPVEKFVSWAVLVSGCSAVQRGHYDTFIHLWIGSHGKSLKYVWRDQMWCFSSLGPQCNFVSLPVRNNVGKCFSPCEDFCIDFFSPFRSQPWHEDWSLAVQTIGRVGPQTGWLPFGRQHVKASQSAGVPRERSASAHIQRQRASQHGAVGHGLPPHPKRHPGRQRVRTTARLLRLRLPPLLVAFRVSAMTKVAIVQR